MRIVPVLALGAAISFAAFTCSVARADTMAKDSMMKSDCAALQTSAMSALHDTSGIDSARSMSASADNMARELMMHADKLTVAAAKLEMSCGKDAAMKTHAKMAMETAETHLEKLNKGP
jgi:hypothetical protein